MDYKLKLFRPWERVLYNLSCDLGARERFYDLYLSTRLDRPDIGKYKDQHKGNRCFIIGGGPSILKTDMSQLADEITFGVNGIFLIFDWLGFMPTYYAVEDWLVYEDRFNDIREKVSESTCFFPIQFCSKEFKQENHRYFRAVYEFSEGPNWPRFSKDTAKVIWIGGTVTYVCLQLAYYMGFNEVYLVGMDHKYTKPKDIQIKGNEWTSQSDDPNHFAQSYFGKGKRWHDPRLDRMEKAYRKARQTYEKDGRKIYNATIGGNLEVFERVDYNELFN